MIKKTVKLSLAQNSYPIVIGARSLSQIGSRLKTLKMGRDAVIITNPVIKKHYGTIISRSLKQEGISAKFIEVPAGEKSKTAFYAHKIIEKIVAHDVFKKIFIIALGGGVVGDLAGYVAAIYKRGIPYVQVPTTLLAQVDSSIGGKVAIDLPSGKNLVGAFYQPRLVFSDVAVLATLDKRQIIGGFSEVIKYGIIKDKDLFAYLEKNCEKLKKLDDSSLNHVVAVCSRIKADVVASDEKETKGLRTILNFGHTVGHAIEAAAAYDQYQHGEAVALGMRVVTDISLALKMISARNAVRINQLLSAFELPEKFGGISLPRLMTIMQNDKKFITGKNRFVLVSRIGTVKVKEGIPLPVIRAAIKKHMR